MVLRIMADERGFIERWGPRLAGRRRRRMRSMLENGVYRYAFKNGRKAGCTKTYIDSGLIQQLLAIWNRAKGKERDALLWGDEVRLAKYPRGSVAET